MLKLAPSVGFEGIVGPDCNVWNKKARDGLGFPQEIAGIKGKLLWICNKNLLNSKGCGILNEEKKFWTRLENKASFL